MKLCPRCSEPYADDAAFCPLDGTPLVRQADPLLGRTLAARYRLVRKIGAGGMAVVYLARHVMIERLSAIKILRQDLGMNPTHRERFLREARAVNRINHPNIVEITDFGEDAGLVFLVMEYVEGDSLLAALREGPMGWTRAAGIALQIASALERAHELGVIHRDLKPENVLLVRRDGGEFVKLTDFGIAKIVDAPTITVSEQRFGTPGYIAPEYIEGGAASPRGDIYSLGVLIYEMLTRKLPFDARFPAELLALALQQHPVAPSARVAGIPPALERLVLRMIARQPDDRPADAFAVDDALTELLRGTRSAPSASLAEGSARRTPSLPPSGDGRDALATAVDEPPADVADRAHECLADLDRRIAAVRSARGEGDLAVARAAELAATARGLLAGLERARGTVAGHQARVDALDVEGREFRARLGHAIDTLSRDRSRERERALDEERLARIEADLGYQVETLQAQLEARNVRHEGELARATGVLEGALAALRRITGELMRAVGDAIELLSHP
ncbi:MAG TPA: serine/threonine-protein kinase [Polyangiaceae bacterium]|nr:serine/threonine-protein kinase [Polyangiaceae bacterium]